MKTCLRDALPLPALIVCLSVLPASKLPGQNFTTLYNFTSLSSSCCPYTNLDGASPQAELVLSGHTLYGTAYIGGGFGGGTIFAIGTNGFGFTTLHDFGFSDGASPTAGLITSNGTLYGTTFGGGDSSSGAVFKLNTDGTGFILLHSFTAVSSPRTNTDGVEPNGMVLSGNTLYGTANEGGTSGIGTVFAVQTDGSGFTTLHSFSGFDGAYPIAGLVLSGNTLYGTATGGGSAGSGTVFKLNTDGTGFTVLYSFTHGTNDGSGNLPNTDGSNPWGRLILSGNVLYGTAYSGGSSDHGTVFAVNTDGTGFRNLHNFAGYAPGDGANPRSGLILSGDTLYGTAPDGGSENDGTVFALKTNGTGFTTLHSFTGIHSYTNSDGARPIGGLIFSGNALYGAASGGGNGFNGTGGGTIYSMTLPAPPAQLTIAPDGYGGFFIRAQAQSNFTCQLQRAPSLTGPWTSSAPQTAPDTGLIECHDLFPPPGQAFYRTVQQ